jgi:hypothetical protein
LDVWFLEYAVVIGVQILNLKSSGNMLSPAQLAAMIPSLGLKERHPPVIGFWCVPLGCPLIDSVEIGGAEVQRQRIIESLA